MSAAFIVGSPVLLAGNIGIVVHDAELLEACHHGLAGAAVLLPRETRNEPFGISKWLFAGHGLLLVERGFGALFGNAPTGVGRR